MSACAAARAARGLAAALALGPHAAGCYRYVPVAPPAVPAREEVRVRITDAAAARLVRERGTYATELDGELARQGADSIAVAAALPGDFRGLGPGEARQVVLVGQGEIVEVRRRQLSRTRTALAGAGALAAFGLLVAAVSQLGDPNPGGEEPFPAPPPAYRLQLRLPLP